MTDRAFNYPFALALVLATSLSANADDAFFESKVRPVLAEHCYQCHGPDKQKANLRLDSLAGMTTGGDSGAALMPGMPGASLLIHAINYQDYEMPPAGKLSDDKIAAITAWVQQGARWPMSSQDSSTEASSTEVPGSASVRKRDVITDEDRAYWAFQPVQRFSPPKLRDASLAKHPIDHFLQAKLEEQGIVPNGPASARDLVRRSYFDLLGLPPTFDEMQTWTARLTAESTEVISNEAYSELLDSLLARPEYGERWGRHWLDVVRYAQTNGYERDGEKPLAWRYRDYVIKAFNEDKPYDRFLLEQLAGDELPDADADCRIATAFYRLGVHDDEPDDARQAEFDDLDDVMVTTGAAFMGLTLGCARCHSHKFDPITHADYYSVLAFFRNIRHYETPSFSLESATLLPISDDAALRAAIQAKADRLTELETQLSHTTNDEERKGLENQKQNQRLDGIEWTMAVRERGRDAPTTNILIRGSAAAPGDEVQPKFLSVLSNETPDIEAPANELFPTSGRRLAFARWLASPEHPLTARVMVNRIWHYHFGRGIVPTTSDFGKAGQPPTHPELLDWLASEFVAKGWSVKRLHKVIMLTEAYRRSSVASIDSLGVALDPSNGLLWRQNLRRLEAEAIRDSILAVTGTLNSEQGGRGFFPRLAGEVLAGGSRPGDGWEVSAEEQQRRRSVFTFVKRTIMAPMLDSFDYANTAQPMPERSITTVAPQALLLLNDRFMHQQANALAERITAEVGTDLASQIQRAYQLTLQRAPTAHELGVAVDFYESNLRQRASVQSSLLFYPDVPVSLHQSYLDQLKPNEVLVGPLNGWTYSRGRWGGSYEGIVSLNLLHSPSALWHEVQAADSILFAKLQLSSTAERAGILFRARNDGDAARGYEVLLLPREKRLVLNRHNGDVVQLAETAVDLPSRTLIPIRIEAQASRIRVWMGSNAEASVDINDDQAISEDGQVGVRVWGGELTVQDFFSERADERQNIGYPSTPDEMQRKTLDTLCLLILNLNELVYID
jgi:mono/diheme cytochrome c family protein